ncbi:MAG TPA: glycine cleavage system protein GcvH [Candidatus Acidoferrales bacterium]|nr:glycine cleavage system protein GcvH [Candidatus Acidoferrales bacterium]
MTQPENLLYSKEHEWVKVDGDTAMIGITDYAQNSLGDIVYVELPRVGKQIEQFGNIGVVESVKAVSDLFTPVSGEVVAVNDALESDPAAVNRDPYGAGWLIKVKVKDAAERNNLLSASEYEKIAHE